MEWTSVVKMWLGLYQQVDSGLYRANKTWQRGEMPGGKDEFTHTFSVFNNTEPPYTFQRKSVSARRSHLQPLQPRSKAPQLSRLHWCGTNMWPLLLYRRGKHGCLCTEEVGPYPEIDLPLNGWRNFETCFDGPLWRRHKNQTPNKRNQQSRKTCR